MQVPYIQPTAHNTVGTCICHRSLGVKLIIHTPQWIHRRLIVKPDEPILDFAQSLLCWMIVDNTFNLACCVAIICLQIYCLCWVQFRYHWWGQYFLDNTYRGRTKCSILNHWAGQHFLTTRWRMHLNFLLNFIMYNIQRKCFFNHKNRTRISYEFLMNVIQKILYECLTE